MRILRIGAGRILWLLLTPLLSACASGSGAGLYHTVAPGETAFRIARAYGIGTSDLLDANGLEKPEETRPGTRLWIPRAAEKASVPSSEEFRSQVLREKIHSLPWPVMGPVASGYGGRRGGAHRGIDILAPEGTEVHAVLDGVAVYAGSGLRGYGNAVILDHGEGLSTLYGHLKEIRVESGDAIAAGGPVGTVGRTGNATTHHLHFEVRLEDKALDPAEFLQRTDEPR